jgi:DNA adenine methylase
MEAAPPHVTANRSIRYILPPDRFVHWHAGGDGPLLETNRKAWAAPLLRWAGSKRSLLRHLFAYVPENMGRYVEPFAGSACFFFALRPQGAILGDLNKELIEAYDAIRSHPRRVSRAASKLPRSSRVYYWVRSQNPDDLSPVDRAARFVYLNRNCFNGVYRVNRAGHFNVPRGSRTGALPSEAEFYRCSVALRSAELLAGDYRQCLAMVRPGDFVYLDPPYASKRRNIYGEYGYGCFAEGDLNTLFDELRRIDALGAKFLLSYCTHSKIREIADSWSSARVRVRRHVAGFATDRKLVTEVLISNGKSK